MGIGSITLHLFQGLSIHFQKVKQPFQPARQHSLACLAEKSAWVLSLDRHLSLRSVVACVV